MRSNASSSGGAIIGETVPRLCQRAAQREDCSEPGTPARSVAVRRDVAAVQPRDPPRNRKADAKAVTARHRASKRLEDVFQIFGRDPDARVADNDLDGV